MTANYIQVQILLKFYIEDVLKKVQKSAKAFLGLNKINFVSSH